MGPADPLPKAAGAPKKAAPAVKPLEQRKKPIRPFQPPPINLQTKPKPSYAKATARSPAKPGPIRPTMVKGKVYVKDPNSGVVYQKDVEFQANTFGDAIPMAQLLSETASKKKKPAKMEWLNSGPTRRQLLLNFEGGATLAPSVMQTLIEFLNQQLPGKGCQLRIDGIRQAYKGYTLSTLVVATNDNIALIRGGIDYYLFSTGATPRKAVSLQLPQSRAFLRLVDVPYWNSVTDVKDVLTKDHLRQYIRHSPVAEDILGALSGEF